MKTDILRLKLIILNWNWGTFKTCLSKNSSWSKNLKKTNLTKPVTEPNSKSYSFSVLKKSRKKSRREKSYRWLIGSSQIRLWGEMWPRPTSTQKFNPKMKQSKAYSPKTKGKSLSCWCKMIRFWCIYMRNCFHKRLWRVLTLIHQWKFRSRCGSSHRQWTPPKSATLHPLSQSLTPLEIGTQWGRPLLLLAG